MVWRVWAQWLFGRNGFLLRSAPSVAPQVGNYTRLPIHHPRCPFACFSTLLDGCAISALATGLSTTPLARGFKSHHRLLRTNEPASTHAITLATHFQRCNYYSSPLALPTSRCSCLGRDNEHVRFVVFCAGLRATGVRQRGHINNHASQTAKASSDAGVRREMGHHPIS